MRKLLFILFLLFISCSSEEDAPEDQQMCCQHTIKELLEDYNERYPEILENPDLSQEQRSLVEKEYAFALDNPCEQFKKDLARSGATCENPF